jgi:hypothetical protein
LPPAAFFWLNMQGGGLIGVFHSALCAVSAVPFDMRLQPKSRYGQFCSAQSIVTNVCKMIAGAGAGYFFYVIKTWFFPDSDYAYRFNFVWSAAAAVVMGIVICSLYRQWQALGGDRGFNPPAPWSEKGYEEMERPLFVGTQVRWLNHALGLTNIMMFSTLAFMIWVAYWLWHIGWGPAFQVYLFALIPVSLLLYLWWVRIERTIKGDLIRSETGEPTRDGIPHHGIFFVKACVLLLGMPVKIGLMIVAIREGLHTGVIVFGIGAQVADLGVILAVLILRRLERGNDPMLDYDGCKALGRSVASG